MSEMNFEGVVYLNQLAMIEEKISNKNEIGFLIDLSKFNKIWFTSDEHFGSQRALELSQRIEFMPNNVSKMNNHIIGCHNQRVGKNDLVIHLGDFGIFNYLTYLNGQHILIRGNYEIDDESFFEKVHAPGVIDKLACGISCLQDNMYFSNNTLSKYFSSKFCDKIDLLYMTHKPEDCIIADELINVIEDSYKPFQLMNGNYIMNLFGHIHEKAKVKPYGLNVGIDCHHYYPFSTEEVEFYLMAILDYYDKNVFM